MKEQIIHYSQMLKEANKQETREAIIDATERLLDRYGYSKMTMTDLAEEAGIGVGTTYLYFPGKIEVALAVLERLTTRIRARMVEIAQTSASPQEKLRQMLTERLTIRFASSQSRRHQMDEFKRAMQPAVDERRAGWLAAEAAIIAQMLEEGRHAGAFHFSDPHVTADTLVRATNSLTPKYLTQQEFGQPEIFHQQVENIVTLLLRGLRP